MPEKSISFWEAGNKIEISHVHTPKYSLSTSVRVLLVSKMIYAFRREIATKTTVQRVCGTGDANGSVQPDNSFHPLPLLNGAPVQWYSQCEI